MENAALELDQQQSLPVSTGSPEAEAALDNLFREAAGPDIKPVSDLPADLAALAHLIDDQLAIKRRAYAEIEAADQEISRVMKQVLADFTHTRETLKQTQAASDAFLDDHERAIETLRIQSRIIREGMEALNVGRTMEAPVGMPGAMQRGVERRAQAARVVLSGQTLSARSPARPVSRQPGLWDRIKNIFAPRTLPDLQEPEPAPPTSLGSDLEIPVFLRRQAA